MTRRALIAAAKAAWLLAVVGTVAWYLWRHQGRLAEGWAMLSLPRALAALGMLLAAKLLLAQSARLSLRSVGHDVGWRESLRMYSVSQLGKYAPGGVWHHVGRFAMYRLRGAETRTASAGMVLESAWLLISAFFLGAVAAWPALWPELGRPDPGRSWHIAGSAFLAAAWVAAMALATRALARSRWAWRTVLAATAIQALVWVTLGLCFWVAMPDAVRAVVSVPYAIGAFALGWAVGYVAVFAPAGLGVREAVMVGLLHPAVPLESAVMLAAVNRVVWTVGELALGLAFLADRGAREPQAAPGDVTEPAAP